jgi:uncharacterized protein (TIGR03067 family)
MVWRCGLCLLSIFLTSVGIQGDDLEVETKKMQGSWKVTASQVNGGKIPLEAFKKVVVVIKDNRIFFKDNGTTYDEIEFDLDLATKPREIDFLYTAGLKKGVLERGIYKLDGDQLTICMAQQKQKRPAEFVSQKGTGQQMFVFKRDKS